MVVLVVMMVVVCVREIMAVVFTRGGGSRSGGGDRGGGSDRGESRGLAILWLWGVCNGW